MTAPPSPAELAALLRAVAHPARLRLLALLAWYEIHPPRPLDRRGRKGLSPAYWWLAGPAGLSPSALSKHLHELRWAGLVAAARGGAVGGRAGPPHRLAPGVLIGGDLAGRAVLALPTGVRLTLPPWPRSEDG